MRTVPCRTYQQLSRKHGKVDYRQAKTIAEAYDKTLKATDPRLRNCVYLIHDEGTTLFYRFAFIMKLDDYCVIFTEHHSFHIYHESDVYGVFQLKEIEEDPEKLEYTPDA